jgi:uncharacterized protein (DUF697 family)
MTTCKEEALRWVHRYAAGGAVFAALPIPFSTSAGLAAMETHMTAFIGSIYGDPMGGPTTAAAGGTYAIMGQGLKYAAVQAVGFVPVLGSAIRMGIAAAAIEGIGRAVVAHHERKFPGRRFTGTP